MNLNERLALAKLSEYLSSLGSFKGSDFIWFSKMFDIKEYQDKRMQISFILMNRLDKELLFDYLTFVYTEYPDRFPKLMEEILRKFFLKFFSSPRLGKLQKDYESIFDIVKNTFVRYLEILGYEFNLDFHVATLDVLDVRVVKREVSEERRNERNKLFNILEMNFKDEYTALRGAYERYLEGGTDAYRQAIDSCRNALENFFKKITGNEKWKEGLNEVIPSKTLIKLIREIYSYLSGYGTHSPKKRRKEDALLAIRLTEDIMIRVLSEKGIW